MKSKLQLFLFCLLLIASGCKDKSTKNIQAEEEQIHSRLEIQNHDSEKSELYYLLKTKDSLMFELSYNQLDTSILEELATDDIEFYHDQGGASYTKKDFIDGMKGLGTLSYKARRELVKGSTQVFPMHKNGKLYAAILKGEHAFYAKEPNDKPEYLTSTAKYTVLWILVDDEWKMSRIFSYDHQSPK